jgi:hypothetical protein
MLKAIFALIMFAGLICIVDLETSVPPFCISDDSTQAEANQNNENCAPVSHAAIAYGYDGFVWIGNFIHEFKDEIVAAFTVILALSTLYLWLATRELVRGAEAASRRQLRPYVIIVSKDIEEQMEAHEVFMQKLMVVNRGQTPAYSLRGISRWILAEHPLPQHFNFTIPMLPNQSFMMLGPGQDTGHNSYADGPFSPIELIKIKSSGGPWRLYNYGRFTYEDSFGTEYWTNFCYYFDWEYRLDLVKGKTDSTIAVHASPYHNDAT